ncbi:MAG: L-asparaginase 1, partial [Flavobacteriales bacterium]|nr:L-asparaginase 1 [Flavobacteriales bacterium]
NRTSKVSANHFNAFSSGNYPLLAEAGITIAYDLSAIRKPANHPLKVHKQLESNIALLKLFPGISYHFVRAIAQTEGLKGLILETFGAGNATTEDWFIAELERLIKSGIPVVNITQCASGSVDQGKYETSSALARIGVISGYDLTTEAAVCKMMFLLAGRSKDFKGDFQRNIAGELSV